MLDTDDFCKKKNRAKREDKNVRDRYGLFK